MSLQKVCQKLRQGIKRVQYVPAGFNPQWNLNFQFDIRVPELAMVRFVVEDYDTGNWNDFVGQYCLPLTSVQNGKKMQQCGLNI